MLHKHEVGGITFYDIKGRGRAKREPVSVGRGVMRYTPEFGFRTKIEVLVPDSTAKQIVDDVLTNLSTGSASDGKIFVYDVAEAYDIGSKEQGGALNSKVPIQIAYSLTSLPLIFIGFEFFRRMHE